MKTINSHPLFGYQLEAGTPIAITSQSTGKRDPKSSS